MTTSEYTKEEQANIDKWNGQVKEWCKVHGTFTSELNGREFNIENRSYRTWQGWVEEWEGWFSDTQGVINVADTPHGVCYE